MSRRRQLATNLEADTNAHEHGDRRSVHGLYTLQRALKTLGTRGIRGNTAVGRTLARWRAELVRDLGGHPSTAQAAIIELALRTRLMLDSVDSWLLAQPSLINKRRRALLPVVTERQKLADALARYLETLGLDRRPAPAMNLDDYLREREEKLQEATPANVAGAS